jgi:hypothetical protein
VIVVATPTGFVTGGRVGLVDDGSGSLKAWTERHVRSDPDIRWLVGNYVEATKPNNNGHIFPLDELTAAQHTLAGKPLNMLHQEQHIGGSFAGAQLVDPWGKEMVASIDANDPAMANPYVEAVAGVWHSRFPFEYHEIQQAHKEGTLFLSMEAIPQEVSCPTCEVRADFGGFESAAYCAHMMGATGPKRLHNPCFAGGAVIIPPVRPGWDRADVRTIAEAYEHAEETYMAVAQEAPDLNATQWEWLMAELVTAADRAVGREFKTKERKDLADKGNAMPDGSFPIKSPQDVKNAVQAIGRTSPEKRPAVKRHIAKMARKLGVENLIPDDWK